jgi:glycogen debranching enzyme
MTEQRGPWGPSHLLAASLPAGGQPHVLKDADTFGVFDQHGDFTSGGLGEEGLYHEGTRFLSTLVLEIQGRRPFYLDSAVAAEGHVLTVILTNPDLTAGHLRLPLSTIHVSLERFLWRGGMYQQTAVTNYGRDRVELSIAWHFAADYVDIFDVHGPRRVARGTDLDPVVAPEHVELGYEGRDGVQRRTRLTFEPRPATLSSSKAQYMLTLESRQPLLLGWHVTCQAGLARRHAIAFAAARSELESDVMRRKSGQCRIETSHAQMNGWIDRSFADLRTLTTELATGPYPYAGVPWFNTPFGRDGLIAAWQCLWVQPALAKGVLAFLAETQARESIPARDAEPGKILHEFRSGELAAIGEIPFGRYYGSVDGTPLFVALAGAYFERTGDLAFVQSIWPSLDSALAWIEHHGDRDGDGFVEYQRASPEGLTHQGWKDSDEAVMHQDGRLAPGPIALCEVQGYAYAALQAAASLARAMGQTCKAEESQRRAIQLRQRFDRALRGPRNLRAGSRRDEIALPRHHLECGTLSVRRDRRMPPGRACRPPLARTRLPFGLGHPDARVRRGAVQSEGLSHWRDMAARQCPDRGGYGGIRSEQRGRRGVGVVVRSQPAFRPAAHARTLLWF